MKDAIQLDLHGEAHVADLVHEERATVSGLEKALAILVGAREGTFHVAEEFGFEEGFRESTAIDGDEGGLSAKAILVDGAGDEFFSGAAFAGDENATGLRGDSLDQVKDGAHLRALADDVVEASEAAKFAAEVTGFFLPLQAFGDFLDGAAQLID